MSKPSPPEPTAPSSIYMLKRVVPAGWNTKSFDAVPTPPVEIVAVAPPVEVMLSPAANSVPLPFSVEGPI